MPEQTDRYLIILTAPFGRLAAVPVRLPGAPWSPILWRVTGPCWPAGRLAPKPGRRSPSTRRGRAAPAATFSPYSYPQYSFH